MDHRLTLFMVAFLSPALARAIDPPDISTFSQVAVSTSTAFETVCRNLQAVTRAEADFTEEKTLQILAHPLQSRGTLIFSPRQGVYRVMEEPVHQEMLITRSQMVQKDAQGHVQRMSVRNQPAARAFVDVFLSFFAGDRGAWEKTFDAAFSGSAENWQIVFTPHRKSPAAQVLKGITIAGREAMLDAMTVTEANGDQTRTQYSNQRISRDSADPGRFPTDLQGG